MILSFPLGDGNEINEERGGVETFKDGCYLPVVTPHWQFFYESSLFFSHSRGTDTGCHRISSILSSFFLLDQLLLLSVGCPPVFFILPCVLVLHGVMSMTLHISSAFDRSDGYRLMKAIHVSSFRHETAFHGVFYRAARHRAAPARLCNESFALFMSL